MLYLKSIVSNVQHRRSIHIRKFTNVRKQEYERPMMNTEKGTQSHVYEQKEAARERRESSKNPEASLSTRNYPLFC